MKRGNVPEVQGEDASKSTTAGKELRDSAAEMGQILFFQGLHRTIIYGTQIK